MADFGSCALSIDPIEDSDFCQGFGGCNSSGITLDSANMNSVLLKFQEMVKEAGNTNLNIALSDNFLQLLDGATVLTTLDISSFDSAITDVELVGNNLVFTGENGGFNGTIVLPFGATPVPLSRIINTTSPLRIDGMASNDLSTDRTISLDIPLLASNPVFQAAIDDALDAHQIEWQPRAGSFAVASVGSGGVSGTVTFATPFPAGVIPHITYGHTSNPDTNNDEGDEDIWTTSATNTGFSWAQQGDNSGFTIAYQATRPY